MVISVTKPMVLVRFLAVDVRIEQEVFLVPSPLFFVLHNCVLALLYIGINSNQEHSFLVRLGPFPFPLVFVKTRCTEGHVAWAVGSSMSWLGLDCIPKNRFGPNYIHWSF